MTDRMEEAAVVRQRVSQKYRALHQEVAAACQRAGRDAAGVTIVGVSKKQPFDRIQAAYEVGLRDFGENYVQEWSGKYSALPTDIRWHFIGRLQRKKIKKIVGKTVLIHSVDTWSHVEIMQRIAKESGVVQPFLLSVNVAGQKEKSGVSPQELSAWLQQISDLSNVSCEGLMTMPPLAESTKPWHGNDQYFAHLRQLRDEYATSTQPLRTLSMGTSQDFVSAIEQGATMVRVGSLLFGARR